MASWDEPLWREILNKLDSIMRNHVYELVDLHIKNKNYLVQMIFKEN